MSMTLEIATHGNINVTRFLSRDRDDEGTDPWNVDDLLEAANMDWESDADTGTHEALTSDQDTGEHEAWDEDQ